MNALRFHNPRAEAVQPEARPAPAVSTAGAIVELDLPAPPSTNALFKNVPGKGRVKTELYDTWLSYAGWNLKAQRPEQVVGSVVVLIGVERTNSRADIDNRIKPTLDLLVAHRVIKDDSHVIGVAAAWSPARNGRMRVAVIPAANLGFRFQLASDGSTGGWFMQDPSEGGAEDAHRHEFDKEGEGGQSPPHPDLWTAEDWEDDAGV